MSDNSADQDCRFADTTLKDDPGSLTIEWMSTNEAAEFLRIPVRSLRNLTSNGKIPYCKLFNLNRYRKDELQALLLKNKRGVNSGDF